MPLGDALAQGGYRSVAVFGLAKNTGKTVTLNHLISEAHRMGKALGLTSIGRDGETWDVLTHRRKPAVSVFPGTLLATAEECLKTGMAVIEPLERTGIATPLGEVVIARVRAAGTVEIAGPGRAGQLGATVRRLQALGSDLVLVDGAIDRRSLASPRITEGCVLATGAVLSESMGEVVERTRARVGQLTLPEAPDEFKLSVKVGEVRILVGGRVETVPGISKAGSKIRDLVKSREAAVLVGGALTDSLLETLVGSGVRVVVRDPTHVFVEAALLERFLRGGGRLETARPLRLAAVTVNPYSPGGWSFEARGFLEAMRRALPGVPVHDVVLEEAAEKNEKH